MSNIPITNDERTISANWLARLTIADGLLLLVAVATAVSRFTNLGHIPLSPDEAAQAWNSWQFWQPGSSVIAGGSPAYFSLTSLLFPLLGDSDAIARLVPALFGLGLVLLPWLLRQRLGAVGALITSLLLALSPTQAIVSRTAGGDAIALFALLLIIVGWLRYESTPHPRWQTTMWLGLALGLTSSPLFYGGLITLAAAKIAGIRGSGDKLIKKSPNPLISAIILFLALSSFFLWYLPGLGNAAALPANWIGRFRFTGGGLTDPLLALIRYEPFLVIGGLAAAIWALRNDNPLATRLMVWSASIILLILLQSGTMENVALLTLPAALLVGLMADHLLQAYPSHLGLAWAGGLFLLFGLVLVNLARFSRVVTLDPQDFTSAWMILMGITVALVTLYFIGIWEGTAVAQGTFLAILAFFALYQWGISWQLTHQTANDPREPWVTTATDDDVRLLSDTAQKISRQTTGADFALDIFSSVDTPVLRWYLRHFKQLQFGHSLPVGAQNDLIISPMPPDLTAADTASPGDAYTGADYGLIRNGLQPQTVPSPHPGIDKLRWWLFNDSTFAIAEERVILWWRVDLSTQ